MAQFGMNGNPDVNREWNKKPIKDDPNVQQTNGRGTITFAHSGPVRRL
jgi:peptidyl-prolyl cis-trans isomerase A (cyclophilin A)